MRNSPIGPANILSSYRSISTGVRETELRRSDYFSQLAKANVFLKLENGQLTGSFKIRGVLSKFASLSFKQKRRGVVAASTGNHGSACAYAAQKQSVPCRIFAPSNADSQKLQAIRNLGAEIEQVGTDCGITESIAREYAIQHNQCYISPYNDSEIISGQGTIAIELCRQLDTINAVFATVGGGGLISGVATYLKTSAPDCNIVGCSPANSNVMFQSMSAGRVVNASSLATLSDGSAGGIENDTITLDLCRNLVQATMTVSEQEIAETIIDLIDQEGLTVEGAAAVSLASLVKFCRSNSNLQGKNAVAILCGGNISQEKLQTAKILASNR